MTDQPEISASEQQLLTTFLQDRDIPCPLCNYNLRNLVGNRCPECGEGLRLHVALESPQSGWFIFLMGSCASGFGGSFLFAVLALIQAPARWWQEPGAWMLLAQLAITGVLFALIIWKRRAFRLASPSTQRRLAWGMCLLVVVLWTIFIALFDG